jgi:hypothetical protein
VPPFAGLPQEEYEIRVAGWRTSWHDWHLSHLWLDPGRVIYTVVQAFYFCCQTYDWWPRRFNVRQSLFPHEEYRCDWDGSQQFCGNYLLTTTLNA